MKIHKKVLLLPALVLLILAGYKLLPQLRGLEVGDILNFTPDSPVLSAGVLLGLYCLKSFTMVIPLLALYFAAAVIFPVGWALLLTYLFLAAEISISYFIGHRFGQKGILTKLENHRATKRIYEFYNDTDNDLVRSLMVRLVPGLPVDLGSMFLGAAKVRFGPYLMGSLIGVSRGAVPIVLMGAAASDPLSPAFLVPLSDHGLDVTWSVHLYEEKATRKYA